MYAKDFIFDGKSCDEFNLMLCNFDNGNSDGDMGANIEFTTTSNPICGKWRKLSSKDTKPLEFQISVCKKDGTYIDEYEEQAIRRWLFRRDEYKKFQFVQDGYEQVWFNAYATSGELKKCGGQIIGITINWKCDASHGYGELYKNEIGENSMLEFFDQSDEVGSVYVYAEINVIKDGIITIYNSIEDREFKIRNCTAGEKIIQDNNLLQLSSSIESHNIYNDFNFNFFRVANTYQSRKNQIITNGCSVKFSYYPIKNVGI